MATADKKRESLDAILSGIWKMLHQGAARFNDPFHWPVFGTVAQDSSALRTVILRQFISTERVLVCHTDSRAPKVKQISNQADVCWLFYHPKKKVQLRISGPATLHTDDRLADEQWAATKIPSRLNYCTVEPPGTGIELPSAGLPDFLLNKVPTVFNTESGRKNFMVIAGQIKSLDWLQLSILGNRRARFDWTPAGRQATWLIP
jgi:pyridoxamine 5'-phosphate oxidase